MFKHIGKWVAHKWKTWVGKAGLTATILGALKGFYDLCVWVIDLPGRWHQLSEWLMLIPHFKLEWPPYLTPVIFFAGVCLLFWDARRRPLGSTEASANSNDPQINARYVRTHLLGRSPWLGLASQLFQNANQAVPPAEHELLFEVHLVNVGECSTTLRRFEAEAELDGAWRPLQVSSLDHYRIVFDEGEISPRTGLCRRKQWEGLPDLWARVKDVELRKGIGYQGWIAFELVIESAKLQEKPMNFRAYVVDALDNRHPIAKDNSQPEVGRITQSPD